jgi:Family of unknown function (DUF5763)
MPEAMDRFLTVNDSPAGADDFGQADDVRGDAGAGARRGVHRELPTPEDLFPAEVRAPQVPPRANGFCLYLGPRGERCSRPAGETGFCSKHQQSGAPTPEANPAQVGRRMMTGFALLAIVLPILLDVLRALARWLASP